MIIIHTHIYIIVINIFTFTSCRNFLKRKLKIYKKNNNNNIVCIYTHIYKNPNTREKSTLNFTPLYTLPTLIAHMHTINDVGDWISQWFYEPTGVDNLHRCHVMLPPSRPHKAHHTNLACPSHSSMSKSLCPPFFPYD